MTNEVREKRGNEINFTSSEADLTSWRKKRAPFCQAKKKVKDKVWRKQGGKAK